MGECKTCGKKGEDLSLLLADHKDLGKVMICQECWVSLMEKGHIWSGS